MGQAPAAFLSPDSKMLAFTAVKRPGDKPQIYVRRLDQLQATPLAETEGVLSAFFSPSSRWIAFFADGKIIQRDAYCGHYLPSGHLVFMHNGTLFGVPFDLKRLELTAQPAPAGAPKSLGE